MIGLIAFDWKVERFTDCQDLAVSDVLAIYDSFVAHQNWKKSLGSNS